MTLIGYTMMGEQAGPNCCPPSERPDRAPESRASCTGQEDSPGFGLAGRAVCLIVDDSPYFLRAARVLLERDGIAVALAFVMTAGALAVHKAGFVSAADRSQVVKPQRDRLATRDGDAGPADPCRQRRARADGAARARSSPASGSLAVASQTRVGVVGAGSASSAPMPVSARTRSSS